MPPSNRLTLLLTPILLSLLAAPALASEAIATDAQIARLARQVDALGARFQARVFSELDAAIEAKASRVLEVHATELLRTRLAARQAAAPPAARRTFSEKRSSADAQPLYTTTCTMVGATFECVLRDHAVR